MKTHQERTQVEGGEGWPNGFIFLGAMRDPRPGERVPDARGQTRAALAEPLLGLAPHTLHHIDCITYT